MPAVFSRVSLILERYNPEHDVNTDPRAPRVTWAEARLADAVIQLAEDNDKLQDRIKSLEERLAYLESRTTALEAPADPPEFPTYHDAQGHEHAEY